MDEPAPPFAWPDDPRCAVPPPVLFNVWKHHAGVLRGRICACAAFGAPALDALAAQVIVMGTELMDLYTGAHWPSEVAEALVAALAEEELLERGPYHSWLEQGDGYRMWTFAPDGSQWVLRLADEHDCYLHLHPGRWTQHTRRVRANVLKTAVLVQAYTAAHGGDPFDVELVNAVRAQYLDLSPMREVSGAEGLGVVLEILGGEPCVREDD